MSWRYDDSNRYEVEVMLTDKKTGDVLDITQHYFENRQEAYKKFDRAWAGVTGLWFCEKCLEKVWDD